MEPESSSSGKSRNLTYLLIFILLLVVIGLLAGGFYINHSRIDNLTKSLEKTQNQVQNAKDTSDEAKEKTAKEAMGGIENTAEAIKDIDNPTVRLTLTKAYAASLRPLLSSARQADLDAVMVYINGNPKVLVTKNTVLPKDVAVAVSNLKTAVKNLKVKGVVTMQKVDKQIYTQGEVVTLTGNLAYVSDDSDLNGSIFTLTDTKTGYVYYLEFNEANSQLIEDTMDGKDVMMTVKVTSKANDPLTFQVLSGPTLLPGASKPSQVTNTPAQTGTNPTP
jgi:hypothetical protein